MAGRADEGWGRAIDQEMPMWLDFTLLRSIGVQINRRSSETTKLVRELVLVFQRLPMQAALSRLTLLPLDPQTPSHAPILLSVYRSRVYLLKQGNLFCKCKPFAVALAAQLIDFTISSDGQRCK